MLHTNNYSFFGVKFVPRDTIFKLKNVPKSANNIRNNFLVKEIETLLAVPRSGAMWTKGAISMQIIPSDVTSVDT